MPTVSAEPAAAVIRALLHRLIDENRGTVNRRQIESELMPTGCESLTARVILTLATDGTLIPIPRPQPRESHRSGFRRMSS